MYNNLFKYRSSVIISYKRAINISYENHINKGISNCKRYSKILANPCTVLITFDAKFRVHHQNY